MPVWRPWLTALAASVVFLATALAVALWLWHHRPEQREIVTPVTPTVPTSRDAPDPAPPAPPAPRLTVVASRPPTVFEKLAVRAAAAEAQAKYRQSRQVPRIDEAVGRLAADPNLEPAAVLAELSEALPRNLIADRLTAIARTGHAARKSAAVRLLGELGEASALPLFAEVSRDAPDEAAKAAAVEAIARLADAPTLAAMAKDEPIEAHRRRLYAGLLGRNDDPRAAVLYLRAVADRRTRGAALAALDDVTAPPLDALFAQLGHADVSVQLAAAKALGHVDGPAVTRRLAGMVHRGEHRGPAVAALLYSDGPEAAAALRAARRYPKLSATIESVHVQASHMF